jgi:transmembrane sensor
MSPAPYEDLELRRQRAMEEAAAWLVRLQEVEPTAAERSSFTDWLRESPLHVGAMLHVSQTEHALKAFDGWEEIPKAQASFGDTVVEWPASLQGTVSGQRPEVNSRRGGLPRRALLGAVAACAMGGIGMVLWWTGVIGGAVYQTSIGERRDVALNDGSTLRLGPQSRVRVVLTGSERDVSLVWGEALFKVAKDPSRPFIVVADRTRVRAVGTEFGVERRSEAVIVTVAEGRVAVSESGAESLPFLRGAATTPIVALAAGDQIEVPRAGSAGTVRKVNSANSLAWANGRLVFDNDSVGSIVQRFNQYNRIRLVVSDPKVAERRVSGSFDATDPQSFLTFLKSAVPVTVVQSADGREITIAAPSPEAAPSSTH